MPRSGRPPPRIDIAAGVAMAALFVCVALLGVFVSKWAIVGGGLVAAAVWAWIRMETGVWVHSFDDVTFRLRRSSEE